MQDENKNNSNPDKLSSHDQTEEETKYDKRDLTEEIEKDLRENPIYNSFFEKYHPNSKDLFIDSYKWKKSDWLQYEEIYLTNEQDKVFKYKNIAEECLWQIQQKKLFNLQCEWRAENIFPDEIKFSWDFKKWEKNIRNCKFITAISRDEADLYKEYILSEDFERSYYESDITWQDHEKLKKSFDDEGFEEDFNDSHYPEWYHYYDGRFGTSYLMSLPDLRKEKESFYNNIHIDNAFKEKEEIKQKQIEDGTYVEPVFDSRPFSGAYGTALDDFINNYEDEKIKRLYRAYLSTPEEVEDDEELYRALETLLESEEKIIMEAGEEWRTSILKTAKNYENNKIHDYFDEVYNEYLQRLEMGISYEVHSDKSVDKMYDYFKKAILDGRKLNGEPEDFNF